MDWFIDFNISALVNQMIGSTEMACESIIEERVLPAMEEQVILT